jgi:uncharacterized membrane protein YuzA (DUF378 family)
MTKQTTSLDVANWYFLSVTSLYAAGRGLFEYNVLTDGLGLTGGALTVVYILFGLSAVWNLNSLIKEGP